ncbi:hypothetical protein H1R20_g11099, partial [Candolleomyces eurysporus]
MLSTAGWTYRPVSAETGARGIREGWSDTLAKWTQTNQDYPLASYDTNNPAYSSKALPDFHHH